MVDLNFTIVVQLLMFLVFLWAMTRWVLRPLLAVMDDRDSGIDHEKEQTQADQETAEKLEMEYAAALAAAHKRAHQTLEEALRETQNSHIEKRNVVRREQQEEMEKAREEANAFLEKQRTKFSKLSEDVAHAMMQRLGLREDAS